MVTEEWWSETEGQLKLNLLFITFDKILECEGSILPSSLYGSGVDQGNEEGR